MAESTPVEIFCSYAPEDESWRRKLETHLSLLRRQGLISLWHNRLIAPGTDWKKVIDTHLETASIILLLVSSDFFASDYCFGIEMQRALARQEVGEVRVLPILIRSVEWRDAPFAHLQVLPTNAKPIATWRDKDQAFTNIAASIRQVIIKDFPSFATSAPLAASPIIRSIPYGDLADISGQSQNDQATFIQEQRAFRTSMTTEGAGSQEPYQIVIDHAKDLLDQLKSHTALSQLETLQQRAWDRADAITRWKILTNMAAGKLQLNEDKEAVRLLLQAKQYNPSDEKTLSNLAFAELLLGQLTQAQQHIEELLQNNPANENAYALQVKLLSLQEEPFENIVERIPEEWRGLQIVAGSLGDAAAHYGDISASQRWYTIAYQGSEKSVDIALAYAASLLAPIVEKRSFLHIGKVSNEQTEQLEKVLTIYNEVYPCISGSENKALKANFFFNRGMTYRFLNNYENATKDFDLATELEPENDRSRYQSALLALLTEKRTAAVLTLEKIQTSNVVPAGALLAMLYQEQGELEKAKEILHTYIEQDHPAELQELAQRTLVETLIASEQYEEAETVSAALLHTFPDHIQSLVVRSSILKTQGKDKEAYECLAKAQVLLTKQAPLLDILALADQYYAFHEYDQASQYYKTIADISVDDDITRKLLSCYHFLGIEREALQICLSLQENYGPLKFTTEIASSIYESIGYLDKAKAMCQSYLQRYPNDLTIELRLASIHLRKQQFDEVDRFLQQPLAISHAPLEEQIYYCQLLSIRGFEDKALKLAYEIRRTFPNESKAHTHYLGLLFTRNNEDDPLLNKSIVEEDTAIHTKDMFGKEQWYIFEARSDIDTSKREFSITHPSAKKFLGKRVGDSIVLSEKPQKREETILEITSKYLYAFQMESTNFPSSFPENQDFQIFHVNIPSQPEMATREEFSFLFDMIDQGYQRTKEIAQAYKAGILTLGTLAKLLQRNPIVVFEQLRNTGDVGVRSASGNPQEFDEAKAHLQSEKRESPQIVADITSLLTWYDLGITDEIVQVFGRIAIVQSTIDILLDMLLNKHFTGEKGYTNLGKEGNTYRAEDITSEHLQKQRAYIQGLFSWVQKACTVIPCDIALTMTAIERKRWYDVYGYDAIDSALLARQERFLFISEDLCLRKRASQSFAVTSIWTQPLLEHLVQKQHISPEKQQKLIIRLVLANYVHTSISVYTIEEAAKQAKWRPDTLFEKVVSILSGAHSEESSAMTIVVEFIFRLYTRPLRMSDPYPLLSALLDAFVTSRNNRIKIVTQLLSRLQTRFSLLPLQQQEIAESFDQWLQGHILY